jgi:hypothetical protein
VPLGNGLEWNEHLSFQCPHLGPVANLEIVKDVIVHLTLGIGGRPFLSAVDNNSVLDRK